MNVSLTPEQDKFIAGKFVSGRYNSASEVVREVLRLLEGHDRARAAQLAAFKSGTWSKAGLAGPRRTRRAERRVAQVP